MNKIRNAKNSSCQLLKLIFSTADSSSRFLANPDKIAIFATAVTVTVVALSVKALFLMILHQVSAGRLCGVEIFCYFCKPLI